MNPREQAHHILDTLPDPVVGELVDFAEFLQKKYPSEPHLKKSQSFNPFRGALVGSPHFNGDLVELQRTLRNEWT